MFTGLVEELGVVATPGSRLAVTGPRVAADARIGDSIAVNGVCLTVVERTGDTLAFDLAPETLSRSALDLLEEGDPVNLERPVTPQTLLGGHIVQGHVDAVGTVKAVEPSGDGMTMTVTLPEDLARYVVEKGSIAVDGVSLTVAAVTEDTFTVALIPHTLAVTTLGRRGPGEDVNLETDVLAKHVERLLRREP